MHSIWSSFFFFVWFACDISGSGQYCIMVYLCITAVKYAGMSNSIWGQTNLISALNAVLGKHRSSGTTLNSTMFARNESLVQIAWVEISLSHTMSLCWQIHFNVSPHVSYLILHCLKVMTWGAALLSPSFSFCCLVLTTWRTSMYHKVRSICSSTYWSTYFFYTCRFFKNFFEGYVLW